MCEAAEEDAGSETRYYLEVSSLKTLDEKVKRQQAKGHNRCHPWMFFLFSLLKRKKKEKTLFTHTFVFRRHENLKLDAHARPKEE